MKKIHRSGVQHTMRSTLSRRGFLGAAAALGTGLFTPAAPARAPRSGRDLNDEVSVGLIGCGSRGPYLGYIFHDSPGVRVTALCDVHREHLEKARKFLEGLGSKPAIHGDYRKLLDDKAIDAVIVATNAHWHVLPAIHACAAGKDVYLEKPVGTSIGEGRAAIRAARSHNRIIQMGTQQRSWDHYHEAVNIVRSGVLGRISHVHVWDVRNFHPGFGSPPDCPPPAGLDWDFWVGPSPAVPYNPNRCKYHYWFFDYGGGWEVAWGTHHYDIVHWAMGVRGPVAATGVGGKFAFPGGNHQWPDTFDGACEYPPGPVSEKGFLLTYTMRNGSGQPVEGREHGKAFYGTDGTLILNRQGYEIRPETRDDKKVIQEKKRGQTQKEHQAVIRHVRSFIDCLRTRKRPFADIEAGHRATNPGHLMNIAWRLGRRVRWDPQREEVIGDPEAGDLLAKRYRKPWSLPL